MGFLRADEESCFKKFAQLRVVRRSNGFTAGINAVFHPVLGRQGGKWAGFAYVDLNAIISKTSPLRFKPLFLQRLSIPSGRGSAW